MSRGTTQDTTLSNMKDKELKIARYDDDATAGDGGRVRAGRLRRHVGDASSTRSA